MAKEGEGRGRRRLSRFHPSADLLLGLFCLAIQPFNSFAGLTLILDQRVYFATCSAKKSAISWPNSIQFPLVPPPQKQPTLSSSSSSRMTELLNTTKSIAQSDGSSNSRASKDLLLKSNIICCSCAEVFPETR